MSFRWSEPISHRNGTSPTPRFQYEEYCPAVHRRVRTVSADDAGLLRGSVTDRPDDRSDAALAHLSDDYDDPRSHDAAVDEPGRSRTLEAQLLYPRTQNPRVQELTLGYCS